MEIRELKTTDWESLSELILAIFRENGWATTFEKEPSAEELADIAHKKIEGMGKGTVIDMVATDGENIIADCEVTIGNNAEGLVGILVAKDYRRKGLGIKLLESCVEAAKNKGVKRLYAEINKQNEDAVPFFLACGFFELTALPEKKDIRLMFRDLA